MPIVNQWLFDAICDLKSDMQATGPFNPFGNTSLTNQVNREIADLKEFALGVVSSTENDIQANAEVMVLERLARAYVSIEQEANEADASAGSRLKAINDIRTKLNSDQKKIFDDHYNMLSVAFFHEKYKSQYLFCNINLSYKAVKHPFQYLRDTWKKSDEVSLSSLQSKTISVFSNDEFSVVNVSEWVKVKYQKIEESIRERIKIKLLMLASIATMWGVHHVIGHKLSVAMGGSKAFAASAHVTTAVAPAPYGLDHVANVIDVTNASTTAPIPASPDSTSVGQDIAKGIAGCVTAVLGACGAVCKGDCKGCDGCCDSLGSACNCGACSDCLGNSLKVCAELPGSVCHCLGDVIKSCLEQIRCSDNCCPQMLESLSQCLNQCCQLISDCCVSSAGAGYTGNTYCWFNDCSMICRSCNCRGCCDCNNPFKRKTHGEGDLIDQVIRERQASSLSMQEPLLGTRSVVRQAYGIN